MTGGLILILLKNYNLPESTSSFKPMHMGESSKIQDPEL